jgi:hypothetical protein
LAGKQPAENTQGQITVSPLCRHSIKLAHWPSKRVLLLNKSASSYKELAATM